MNLLYILFNFRCNFAIMMLNDSYCILGRLIYGLGFLKFIDETKCVGYLFRLENNCQLLRIDLISF